ncbi:MAG: hypothetical protein A3K66_04820 [Euryarchaeota archaeon RBG_16_67_27]|nr:MAG: hypothetical protein A3K66_04820 [Euryarchaeota archaeon RBG_16_67_27]
MANLAAIVGSSRMSPTSRFSVAEAWTQFRLPTNMRRPSTRMPLLCTRSIRPWGPTRRASTSSPSRAARALILPTTSSLSPASPSVLHALPSRRKRTCAPRRAASNAASRYGLGVPRQRSSRYSASTHTESRAEARSPRTASSSSDVSGPTTRRARRGVAIGPGVHDEVGSGGPIPPVPGSTRMESLRRGSKSASNTSRSCRAIVGSSRTTVHPRFPSSPAAGNPAFPKFSELTTTRASSITAYFACRYRYRFTTSSPPRSHRTDAPADARPMAIRRPSSLAPPAGEPSRRRRTRTPRRAASANVAAIASLVRVYTDASSVAVAEPSADRRTSRPSSGETATAAAPAVSTASNANCDWPSRWSRTPSQSIAVSVSVVAPPRLPRTATSPRPRSRAGGPVHPGPA